MNLDFNEAVLLVEDTPSLSMVYQAALEKAGLNVTAVYRAREARQAFSEGENRIVLLDLMLPDGDGLDILREIHRASPRTKVIVITANGSINRAVQAMRGGAFDFLVKPFDDRRLLSAVEIAIRSLEMDASEDQQSRTEVKPSAQTDGFVGSSPEMLRIYEMIRDIGRSTATVFITGESGTGKEIAAHAIHRHSIRKSGPFIAINCGAIPRDLLESEVFGHLKGSFTGAISDKAGAAAAADGGTLFLDEICEMDQALQTKLLRFLQTSMIQPVGAVEPRKVDVRIVCATNRDPVAEVKAGRFREDLFYRLHVVPILMPPLRDRGTDVLEIADSLLERFSQEERKRFVRLADDVRHNFCTYNWPGNVRQLENVLRNAIVLNDGLELTADMIPNEIAYPARMMNSNGPGLLNGGHGMNGHSNGHQLSGYHQDDYHPNGHHSNGHGTSGDPAGSEIDTNVVLRGLVGSTLAVVEREFIEMTIRECDGSIPRAARILDVSPSTLYRKREAWDRSPN